MPGRRPTIADLAKASGVSIATVNRILGGNGSVRPATIGRVPAGVPAFPGVVTVGGLHAEGGIETAVAAEFLVRNVPFPAPSAQRIERQAHLLVALAQLVVGQLRGHEAFFEGRHNIHAGSLGPFRSL